MHGKRPDIVGGGSFFFVSTVEYIHEEFFWAKNVKKARRIPLVGRNDFVPGTT
jgi:hypothetical protein